MEPLPRGANFVRAKTLWEISLHVADNPATSYGGNRGSAPENRSTPNFNRSERQAAALLGWTSKTLREPAIGIARGFIASGISRTRSTCKSPFSSLAPLTTT
jgi:hypothetical protein